MVRDEMTHLYKNLFIGAAATIFTLTIIIVASSMTANAAAATTTITTTATRQQPLVNETTEEEDTSNNNSGSILGSLFMIHEGKRTSFNPINDTYTEISVVSNTTIMPPKAPGVVINATERGNLTLNILPNGLYIEQGQAIIVTEDGAATARGEKNATATFVSLGTVNPNGTGSRTGIMFFSTNSTGQLAFLDNLVGIYRIETSPEGYTIRIWEWKGETIPFETTTN
jgi:hypothetical protein